MIHQARSRQRKSWRLFLSIPFIYIMVLPIGLLDVCVCIYQAVCFPLYDIKKVSRNQYLRFDRAAHPGLDAIDRLQCNYCSYANGILSFAREVAKQTEYYWCPIRNKIGGNFIAPEHHQDFAAYTDQEKLEQLIKK